MIPYDQDYEPPAPMLAITVSGPANFAARADAQALLDTGAEISVIPDTVVKALALTPYAHMLVESYDGQSRQLPLYLVTIELPAARLRSLRAVAYPTPYAILGRDVLNHFLVTLDGPRLLFDVTISSPPS